MSDASFGRGIICAILAYFLWGILPLYWKLVAAVDPLHILAFRILLSLVLVGTILLANKNTAWLAVFRSPKKAVHIVLTSLILSCNWGIFIWAVNEGHTIEASLGYYINPLVSIVLGLVFFRETLRPLQWAAVAVAMAGVLILTVLLGVLPWISLGLAFSFGFYALLKKKLGLNALESLGAETLAGVPIGLFLICFSFGNLQEGALTFSGFRSIAYIAGLPAHTLIIFASCGVATMLPLYFFSCGTKLLPLSALGFTQFTTPTIQFFLGLFVFGETFPPEYFIAFMFIWTAVIIYIISLKVTPVKGKSSLS